MYCNLQFAFAKKKKKERKRMSGLRIWNLEFYEFLFGQMRLLHVTLLNNLKVRNNHEDVLILFI